MRLEFTKNLQSPVLGSKYQSSICDSSGLSKQAVKRFMTQWYAFSAFIPKFLCLAAFKAETDDERLNVLKNLNSEIGLEDGSPAYAELLSDLIEQATGDKPTTTHLNSTTRNFLEALESAVARSSAAYNSGVMLGLEHVAYDILKVLKEILLKSENAQLLKHPYITIHEEIEQMHIDNTEDSIGYHSARIHEVQNGFEFIMKEWENFWSGAYDLLTPAPPVTL